MVLGLDVDYGNDKGGYAILPVSKDMVLNDEKIITWSDYRKNDGEATFGLLSQVSPDGRYVFVSQAGGGTGLSRWQVAQAGSPGMTSSPQQAAQSPSWAAIPLPQAGQRGG